MFITRYNLFIVVYLLVGFGSILFSQKNQNNECPKTYDEAVEKVINFIDERTKDYLKKTPYFEVGYLFDGIIHANGLISYSDPDFNKSCADRIGQAHYIGKEDIAAVIIRGVWKKLNSELDLTIPDQIDSKQYFEIIIEQLKLGKQKKKQEYFATLPPWYFKNHCNVELNHSSSSKAIQLLRSNNEFSYIGALYLSCNEESYKDELFSFLNEYLKNTNDSIEIINYLPFSSLSNQIYRLEKQSYQDFALQSLNWIYNKKFESLEDYQKFYKYNSEHYLAKWKFQKYLSIEDVDSLISNPRELLEILTLTETYYYKNSELFDRSNERAQVLVDYFESIDTVINSEYPFFKDTYNKEFNKSINALVLVANQINDDELYEIINPKSITNFNNTVKTEDIVDYKYLVGFLMITQKDRILKHPNKIYLYDLLEHYWTNVYLTSYFANLMYIVNPKKANQQFQTFFKDEPKTGNFKRHTILEILITNEFNNNKEFVENWFWKVYRKDFNLRPIIEYKLILQLLKDTNLETKKLYDKITSDSRFNDEDLID